MTDLQKYELVNSCETIQELKNAILKISDKRGVIQGKSKSFSAGGMALGAENYFNDPSGAVSPNIMTRMWGIRQQAMYLKYYNTRR